MLLGLQVSFRRTVARIMQGREPEIGSGEQSSQSEDEISAEFFSSSSKDVPLMSKGP